MMTPGLGLTVAMTGDERNAAEKKERSERRELRRKVRQAQVRAQGKWPNKLDPRPFKEKMMAKAAAVIPDTESLRGNEAIVAGAIAHFVEAGRALDRIRERALYLENPEYTGWVEYTRKRWGISVDCANRWIDASRVQAFLQELFPEREAPSSKSVLYALSELKEEPELLVEVWGTVTKETEGALPSVAQLHSAIQKLAGKSRPADTERRDKWMRGEFNRGKPRVEFMLDPFSAQWLAVYAEKRNLTLSEAAKRICSVALKSYAEKRQSEMPGQPEPLATV